MFQYHPCPKSCPSAESRASQRSWITSRERARTNARTSGRGTSTSQETSRAGGGGGGGGAAGGQEGEGERSAGWWPWAEPGPPWGAAAAACGTQPAVAHTHGRRLSDLTSVIWLYLSAFFLAGLSILSPHWSCVIIRYNSELEKKNGAISYLLSHDTHNSIQDMSRPKFTLYDRCCVAK